MVFCASILAVASALLSLGLLLSDSSGGSAYLPGVLADLVLWTLVAMVSLVAILTSPPRLSQTVVAVIACAALLSELAVLAPCFV